MLRCFVGLFVLATSLPTAARAQDRPLELTPPAEPRARASDRPREDVWLWAGASIFGQVAWGAGEQLAVGGASVELGMMNAEVVHMATRLSLGGQQEAGAFTWRLEQLMTFEPAIGSFGPRIGFRFGVAQTEDARFGRREPEPVIAGELGAFVILSPRVRASLAVRCDAALVDDDRVSCGVELTVAHGLVGLY